MFVLTRIKKEGKGMYQHPELNVEASILNCNRAHSDEILEAIYRAGLRNQQEMLRYPGSDIVERHHCLCS